MNNLLSSATDLIQKKTLQYIATFIMASCCSYASIGHTAAEAHTFITPATENNQNIIEPEKGFFASLLGNIFRFQTKERVQMWRALIETYKDQQKSKKEQIQSTNLFFNQLRFRSDNKHWNQEDYWATPIEMLTTNGGDCEDFSIAKFFTLKKMGIDENQMRMIYVESTLAEEPHMVLAYYPTQNSDPLILDNLMDDIKPLSERDDLFPVYSFNNHGIWIEKGKQLSIKISDINYISHWKTLKARMEKETPNS